MKKILKLTLLIAILSSCATVNMKHIDTRRAPREMRLTEIQAYIGADHGRYSSEFTVVLSIGKDSAIYQTYLTDKSWWIFIDKK